MRHLIWLIYLLIICGSLTYRIPVIQAMPLPSKAEMLARGQVLHDQRLSYDVANLDFSQIQDSQAWFVGKIKSDADSPTFKSGAHIEMETGKLVRPPGARDVFRVHGSIEILAPLTTANQSTIKYELDIPMGQTFGMQRTELTEMYSALLFSVTEVIVFRFNEQEKEWTQFSPVCMIPESWVPFVLPALKYVRMHVDIFDNTTALAHHPQLQALLSDANPFLALSAARTLSHAHLLDVAFVQETLAHADGLRQSAFAYLILQSQKAALIEEVGKIIDTAPTVETLQAVSTGLIALFYPRAPIDPSAKEHLLQLLRRVDKRQAELGTHTAADDYLQTLLVMEEMRPPAPLTSAPAN